MARTFNPNQKTTAIVGVVLLIATLAVLNVVVNLAPLPYLDASPDERHRLDPATLKVVEEIEPEDPVTISFYYTPDVVGLPREVDEAAQEVRRMLELYQQVAGERLEVEIYHPDPLSEDEAEQEVVDQAHRQGIRRFERYWNQNSAIIYCGLVVERASRRFVFDNIDLAVVPQLEFQLTSAIHRCISDEKKKLGLISGLDFRATEYRDRQGQPQTMPEWQILSRLNEEFDVVWIEDPATEVESCDVLLLVQPRGLSKADFQAIDQHIMEGKGALFCEAPFSFQEVILLSQAANTLQRKVQQALQDAAVAVLEEPRQRWEDLLAKKPQLKAMYDMLRQGRGDRQMEQRFMMQLYADSDLKAAFEAFQQAQQEAMEIANRRQQPEPGSRAARLLTRLQEMATAQLPPGRLVNQELLHAWGVHLRPRKLLFVPSENPEDATVAQFSFTVDNPRSFAQDRLEAQNVEALHPSFCGVLEPYGESQEEAHYHSLVRVDKQFSFFVPNPKAKINDWFALDSFQSFVSAPGGRPGDRYQQWTQALQSQGDRLTGWFDICAAIEGTLKSAFPDEGLEQTADDARSRVVVMASVDILERPTLTEDDAQKQRENHRFVLELLNQLSLPPEVAALSRIGDGEYRFHVLEELTEEAQAEAAEERKVLEEYRQKRREEARRKYDEALERFPKEQRMVDLGGLVLQAEHVPEEQRIAMEKAERELNEALEELKAEESEKIERIESKVARAARVRKIQARWLGTLLPPGLILVLGLVAFGMVRARRD